MELDFTVGRYLNCQMEKISQVENDLNLMDYNETNCTYLMKILIIFKNIIYIFNENDQ